MENYVSQQLMIFGRSILLGMGVALLYDLLRPVRRRCPRLVWLLDGAYCIAAALAVGLFLLRQGDGEFRLYILLGAIGGAVLFFGLFSRQLEALWEFWADTAVQTGRLLSGPGRFALRMGKKSALFCKNLFYFAEKCYTIGKNGGMGRSHAGERRQQYGKDRKEEAGKGKTRRQNQGKNGLFHKDPDRRSAGRHGLAAERPAGEAGRR